MEKWSEGMKGLTLDHSRDESFVPQTPSSSSSSGPNSPKKTPPSSSSSSRCNSLKCPETESDSDLFPDSKSPDEEMDYGEEMDRTIASPRYPLWAPLELKSTKLVHVQQDFNPPWASQSSHSERGGEEGVLHVQRTVSCGSDDPLAWDTIDKNVIKGKTVSCGSDDSLPDLDREKILNEKLNSDESTGEESQNEIPDTPPLFLSSNCHVEARQVMMCVPAGAN